MRLYLAQHGEARSEDVDPERHLTDMGRQVVRKLVRFMGRQEIKLGAVWHSGKTRAAETAELFAAAVAADGAAAEHKGLDPDDPVKPVRDEVSKASDDLMIVGHLPFLQKLAALLVAGNESADIAAFQGGGVVCLERADGGSWVVRWAVTPDILP